LCEVLIVQRSFIRLYLMILLLPRKQGSSPNFYVDREIYLELRVLPRTCYTCTQ
jgi:hypothetical protein